MKNKKLVISIFFVIIIVSIFVFLFYKIKANKNPFLGTWISDGGTIYEFREKNEGVMKTSRSEYKFTYKIKDDILSIDFSDKRATDTDYKYDCKKDKCIVTSDRGTFTFNKK